MGLPLTREKRKWRDRKIISFDQHVITETDNSVLNVPGGDMVYIIPEDNQQRIKPAYWAYGDHVLEDLMFGKNLMKCLILADTLLNKDIPVEKYSKLHGILGVCIDHGGDNYIVFPIMDKEVELKKFIEYNYPEFLNTIPSH